MTGEGSSSSKGSGSDSDGEPRAKKPTDPRLKWFRERVMKTMVGVTRQKWNKMMENTVCLYAIHNFCEESDQRWVLLYLNPVGALNASLRYPEELKSKSLYFIKKRGVDGPLSLATMDQDVYQGDLGPEPLKQLSLMVDELYTPLLKNNKNHSKWPQVVAADVLRHFHNVASSIYVIDGLTKGKTLLPLPPDAEEDDENAQDKSLIHQLESAVIEWTHQVRAVVKSTSLEMKRQSKSELPHPLEELDFWKSKANNLQCIHAQLRDEKMKKIGKILEITRSSYYPAFQNIYEEVHAALLESYDIHKCLEPLRKYFVNMGEISKSLALVSEFKPMMHVLSLVWKESEYYTVSHLVTLVQEIAGMIIENLMENEVDGERIFKLEPAESLEHLETALYVLTSFKNTFFVYKTQLSSETPERAWRVDNDVVFKRTDLFVERLKDLLQLVQTIVEFRKLEKVEIGGSKGKILTAQVAEIFNEFDKAVQVFSSISYDVLDSGEMRYHKDASDFRNTILDLEWRISTVISDGFDDCVAISGAFKLVDSFAGMLHRPSTQREFENKFQLLLEQYSADLDTVYAIFRNEKDNPPIAPNLPRVSGSLLWSRNLRHRIEAPYAKLVELGEADHLFDTPKGTEVTKKYKQLMDKLAAYDGEKHSAWGAGIDFEAGEKLDLPILKRDSDSNLLTVNFDPALVTVLREVKYLRYMDCEIPESARAIFDQSEAFRHYISSLDAIVNRYNTVLTTMIDVERPLVEQRLVEIDQLLEPGLDKITWRSSNIGEFTNVAQKVNEVGDILETLKSNVRDIERMMKSWRSRSMIERKDPKKPLDLEAAHHRLRQRSLEIELQGTKIHALMRESRDRVQVEEDFPPWKAYVAYVNSIVSDGFLETARVALDFLAAEMRSEDANTEKSGRVPLFEVQLRLEVPEVVFNPPLNSNERKDLKQIFLDLMNAVLNIGSLVKRLDGTSAKDTYFQELNDDPEISRLKTEVLDSVAAAINDCIHYKNDFMHYHDLWITERDEYMEQFLLYGKMLAMDQEELLEDDPEESPPTLADFEHQIDQQIKYYESVKAIHNTTPFHWLKVDARPFKNTLTNIISKWKHMFIQYLSDDVVEQLDNLQEFIEECSVGLNREVAEGDYAALVETMSLLRDVRSRQDATDAMFEPLKLKINLLKRYGIEFPQTVLDQLNDLPQAWANLKKLMFTVKDSLTSLQSEEVRKIKNHRAHYVKDVAKFREAFLEKAPFNFDVPRDSVYDIINHWHIACTDMEQRALDLADQEGLFELTILEYKEVAETRTDLINLKNLWDLICLVRYQFDEWKATPWQTVDTDNMEQESKQFLKMLKEMRECKAWEAYQTLETYIKNLMKSLRSVADLRSPAMRDRHWRQLMSTTGVFFDISGEVKLEELLSLQLHKYDETVRNVVEKATLELQMENQMAGLDNTWRDMHFDFDTYKETVPVLKPMEELMETLEENNVTLQNMRTSKYVSYFVDKITEWEKLLSNVDSVINLWMEVQRDWMHLESIFLDSEDIREQLPDDTKRFDGIDREWRKLMDQAKLTPNVVEACSKENLFETLEQLESELATCSKALDEYLETKRLAFPRFYFISKDDLLDILAKGNDPLKVGVHLFKLFDAIKSVHFEADGKTATDMRSPEGEIVPFSQPCECVGPVEVWLERLVETMRKTLREILGEAVESYEELPREDWLDKYPAQIALTGSQIWWTTEVEQAFERLEEGYDNALKEYSKKQRAQLTRLIKMLQGDMEKGARRKIMTICTIDTHARDVIQSLMDDKAESATEFGWQSQLRFRWDEEKNDCYINICDAEFQYQYEYLGNAGRLVITPLTDRCYITLTQSLRLVMGGAPAGPAGTGKTETTKDLGRALGLRVLVQNCSPQQTYMDMANIFKGLAQSGMWGCFDEFNRISIDVLSVVATQVKTILDGIRANKGRFNFMGEDVRLVKTVGIFITMNPGYAGRTELPDNLKALFRPVSMVVPDLDRICEIMLMAEGFEEAQELSQKFITLYSLSNELLSQPGHYDWGLRAIKPVLVVAGKLKRDEPEISEKAILMRALRDFNLPKIVTEDIPVFKYLIGDLFPSMELTRKENPSLEKHVHDVAVARGLQPEPVFILKCVQLDEILEVRHSVFIIGPSGSAKTEVWKTLAAAYTKSGQKCIYKDLNPKAVSSKELFGYKNPVTKEPMDGLFSSIMRDLSKIDTPDPKWIVLDGDIDPDWIESLNTVMDDNKVLTLPSNERIQLNSSMRLLFEIGNVKHATPATISRAGILYLNETDIGWDPYFRSWIERRKESHLSPLFDRYVQPTLDYVKKNLTHAIDMTDFQMVQTLCHMLDGLLTPESVPPGCDREVYEIYFVFAIVWAVGGSLINDAINPHRTEFSKWFKSEFKSIKFPSAHSVFDYRVDPLTHKWALWADSVPTYMHDPALPVSNMVVHTPETWRVRFWLDLFIKSGKPIMLVGNAGCGKTRLVEDALAEIKSTSDNFASCTINFNYYTDSAMLQSTMENQPPLERKVGKDYGPPGTKKLIYFIDDITMPQLDEYETQTPHTLLRQHLDYGHWYDRSKWDIKTIKRCQYMACLNPTTGSFSINPRLQRHFAVFAITWPGRESLIKVFESVLQSHFDQMEPSFVPAVSKYTSKLVSATLDLHQRVSTHFLPTAVKFHYQFNLRSLSQVFQGLLNSHPSTIRTTVDCCQLWVHEVRRVYSDVLTSQQELESFSKMVDEAARKNFDDVKQEEIFEDPLIFAHFANGMGDPFYTKSQGLDSLNKILVDALNQYNDMNAEMDLVLFNDAMMHVARISRIIMNPRGSALLVGVGGSGKQSLARLAAFVNSFDVVQIQIKANYGIADLKADLIKMYKKCGKSGDDLVFLLTDAQVVDERFLIYINDLLANGNIPGLFPPDEVDSIVSSLRSEVKQMGIADTKDNVWSHFIDKVHRHLHVVLCFSPVGDTLRNRYRCFPALVNCTSMDWFHPWPQEALLSVATYFLKDTEIDASIKEEVVNFVAYAHGSVERASSTYLQSYRRYNYTTPKSFLELIKLYKSMLSKKRDNTRMEKERLLSGLERLKGASEQVAQLHEKLDAQKIDLDAKSKAADELVEVLGRETEKVSKERQNAEEEEARTNVVRDEVSQQKAECDMDLKKAEPALLAAEAALKTFTKDDLTLLARMPRPPNDVKNVLAAVIILQTPEGRKRDVSWKAAQQLMSNVGRFYESLISFDRDHVPKDNLKALQPYLSDKNFTPEIMVSKSTAASGICGWVINIVEYTKVYEVVQPKREALAQATLNLENAEARLEEMRKKLHKLDIDLKHLTEKFEKANKEKMDMQEEAEKTRVTIELANRLVSGLASEGERWNSEVGKLDLLTETLVGDVLLASGFISYIGSFNRVLREELTKKQWLPWLSEHKIPLSTGYDPLKILTSDAEIARWNNEGLPSDRVSLENAAICCNCQRWPLMVDPQLQGVQWIKQRTDLEGLITVRLDQERYMDAIIKAISEGTVVLVEGVEEELDPQLDPLLGRNLINKGKNIRIGGKTVDYNPNFQLILQTKLGNPHFKPEIQAQTTLINFTVTEDGLEDQLLASVVNHERLDLEEQRTTLIRTLNEYEIKLKDLESDLLKKLQDAKGDFLSDTQLVENLETTKATADDINAKKKTAMTTQARINETRNAYRPVAARASLLYFLLDDLSAIDHMYQFSLKAFVVVFLRAIERCPKESEEEEGEGDDDDDHGMNKDEDPEAKALEELKHRVEALVDEVTFAVYTYAARGLFVRHKLIFVTMMAFRIMSQSGKMNPDELAYLLRGPMATGSVGTKLEWCTEKTWRAIVALSKLEDFKKLPDDIEGSSSRWKKWSEEQMPETSPMPQDWKTKTKFQKLCIIRAIRPDRLINAVSNFIAEYPVLGPKYVDSAHLGFESTLSEAGPETPIFFILSPGVDPVKSVESYARQKGYTEENGKFKNVSLGQGQERLAMEYLEYAHKEGAWVILQNIHLMTEKREREPMWLPILEKKLEQLSEGSHENYRVFLSAEPSPPTERNAGIPIGILQRCIKVTNEPPRGMRANMLRALSNFDQDALEQCSKESEFHRILFTMCFFHAVVLERRKFGAQGWNRPYNFNTGDLTISIDVLNNYLENNAKVPWEDLRYIFGEIMYGGHISDNWDRRLCSTYLKTYIVPALLNDEMELVPGYPPPSYGNIESYRTYIEEYLPPEDPSMFGLNRNAEIGFLTEQSNTLFKTILSLQPTMAAGGTMGSREDKVANVMKQITSSLESVNYNMTEMYMATETKTNDPYVVVALQECERMNALVGEIKRSLNELQMGMQGDLMMSEQMESLMVSLYEDAVPSTWALLAYPSLKPLGQWVDDLTRRVKQLDHWTGADFKFKVMWLPGLFNPQSFLTAIMQTTARNKAGNLPLDRMKLVTEVTKKTPADIPFAKADGAYVTGLYLEGARWDTQTGQLADALPKELVFQLPVVYIKAVTVDKVDDRDQYICPVYMTRQRGPTFVWGFNLRCKNPAKWTLAGTAILLSAE